jgi:LEA14-like dessication related protein
MSKHGKVLWVVIIVVAIIAGVVAYYFFFKGRFGGVVSVTGVELYVRPSDVSEAQTPIEVFINVENSFPVSVKVEGGSLAVILSGLRLADVSIPAQEVKQGRTTLVVNAILDNTLLDDFWYRHLSQGEKSNMSIEGSIRVGTPIGSLKLPVRFSSIIETKIFPIVQELNREYDVAILGKVVVRKAVIELVNVTPYETKLKASITIENDLKALPLYMSGVVFNIKTGGGNTLGFGEQETPKIIAPSEIDTIVFSVTIDNTKIPKLWVEHIRNMEKTIVNIEIWLKVKIAGKELELFKECPLTASTEIKTNIFKYKG